MSAKKRRKAMRKEIRRTQKRARLDALEQDVWMLKFQSALTARLQHG